MKFNSTFLEQSAAFKSRFLENLEESIGEKTRFEFYKNLLFRYLKLKSIKTSFSNFLEEHNIKIFVEIAHEELPYLKEIFVRLKEDNLYKKDKRFIGDLFLNALDKGDYFLVLLFIAFVKLYPSEIISNIQEAIRVGKRFINLFMGEVPIDKLDPLARLISKDPLFLGFSAQNLTIRDLAPFLANFGFTPSVFIRIHEILIEDFTEREAPDIISLFKNSEINNTQALKNFPFADFFIPSGKTLEILAKTASVKAEKEKKNLIERDLALDDKAMKLREETNKFIQNSLSKLKALVDVKNVDLSTVLLNMQKEITKLEGTLKLHVRMVQELKNLAINLKEDIDQNKLLLGMKAQDIRAFIPSPPSWEIEKLVREFWHAQPFLAVISPASEKAISRFLIKEEKVQGGTILSKLSFGDRKTFSPDIDKVIYNYKLAFGELLEVIFVREVLNNMVEIWPPSIDFENPRSRMKGEKIIHLVGLNLLPRGYFYRFSKDGKIRPKIDKEALELKEKISFIIRKNFSSLVSVLVYDIRGSTFMSHRLRDADRERAILSLFQSYIFESAKRGSSFILKDTGDGGIMWFGGNSQKLYREIYKTSTTKSGKMVRHSTALEDEFYLLPYFKSAEMAIKTALDMVKTAEDFVKENYVKYREWFGDIKEKEILHEGITYALLPPQFKSLFRLGVGISSGIPGKDISFSPNAFGDPDLNGILVDEASLLSSGKSPERSVVLIDNNTLINLLLNSEAYLLTSPLKGSDSEKEIIGKLLYLLKGEAKDKTFFFEGFTVSPVGIYNLDEEDKRKAIKFEIPKELSLTIDENGELMSKEGRIKLIYEVLPIEEKNEEES
ncbi:MAG: hypothetical protein ABIN61_07135 [candidate division WOR-3 bacterium]